MTAALQTPVVSCPVCGGEMYDNRGTKKNPKQPDFKCKRYKEGCEGVIWPPKFQKAGKIPAAPQSNVPNQQLPPLLQNQAEEDAAELAAKIGDGRKEALAAEKAKHAFAMKHANEFVIKHIVPLYTAVEIGLTGDDCYKQAFTIFKQWEDKGLIE